jgi:flavin-binding protein dodecin
MNSGSTYKIIELVGTSPTSWEDAAKNAIETASKSLRDLRIAEITRLDLTIEDGKITGYRARINVSFKYHIEQ